MGKEIITDCLCLTLMNRVYRRKIYLLVLTFVWVEGLFGQTNEGTDFWFGFMEHVDVNDNSMVAMITAKKGTSGEISIPLQGWSRPFTVGANAVTVIPLPASAENIGSESVSNRGIRVTSRDPVSVYIHQYHEFRSEAAVVLPTGSIGREYYIMTYQGVVWDGEDHESEFLIIGTQDDTEINITVSDQTLRGKSPGTTFTIKLDAGQTYQVQARTGNQDLTGSYLVADKDVAVFAGCSWTEVPVSCGPRDNLLEQMYSVDTWGRKFVTVPNDKVNYDVFRIIASEPNTSVTIEGTASSETIMLDAGEYHEYRKSEATYVQADKSILVAQFNVGSNCSGHSVGDPSMVLLNSVEQTRDTVTLFNSRFENITENFINIITKTENVDATFFDGQGAIEQGIIFNTVGPNDEFSYARVQVNDGAHTIISEGCGVIATAYGYGRAESYAYSGGAAFTSINAKLIPEGGCLNDTIFFDTGLSPERYNFDWDLGDGNRSILSKFQHFYPGLGTYPVRLILTDNCLNTVDTLFQDLMITLRQAVDAPEALRVCEGELVDLSATDVSGARYEWTGPNRYFSEEQFPVIRNTFPGMSGRYEVIGIVSGCATFPAITEVEVTPTPEPDLGPDTLFCARGGFAFALEPGDFTTYRWQDNNPAPTYNIVREGSYGVTVTDEFGCQGEDVVELREVCPTVLYKPTAFSPDFDGINDEFRILGTDIISLHLSVYDRWGSLVFASPDHQSGWDGTWNGEPAPEGVYVWMAQIEGYKRDGTTFTEVQTGSVLLVR